MRKHEGLNLSKIFGTPGLHASAKNLKSLPFLGTSFQSADPISREVFGFSASVGFIPGSSRREQRASARINRNGEHELKVIQW